MINVISLLSWISAMAYDREESQGMYDVMRHVTIMVTGA